MTTDVTAYKAMWYALGKCVGVLQGHRTYKQIYDGLAATKAVCIYSYFGQLASTTQINTA